MEQRPEQPPEGKLIEDAADRLDLSIREAARRAGLSYGRWRQIVQGYQNVSPGSYAKVRGPARTLARMAAVVGITAEQMEAEGQRPDAAEVMRRAAPPPVLTPVTADAILAEARSANLLTFEGDTQPRAEEHLLDLAARVANALTRNPASGPIPTGAEVFGSDTPQAEFEGRRWDNLVQLGKEQPHLAPEGFDRGQLLQAAVLARLHDDEHRAGRGAAAAGR